MTTIGARGQRIRGTALLGAAAVIWGSLFVAADWLMRFMPPFGLLELRFLIGGALIALIAAYRGELRLPRGQAGAYALLGLVGYLGAIGLQFVGTHLAGAAAGSLITAASPALIALFAVPLLGETISWRRVLALALGLLGIAAVVGLPGPSAASVPGDLALGGSGTAWALYTVLARRATLRASSLTVTAWAGIFGTIFTLPAAVLEYLLHPWALPATAGAWAVIAYVGVVCTAGAFYLWNRGFEYLPAGSGGLLLLLQPVVGGALGAVLLGERLGAGFLAGSALIGLGVAAAFEPEPRSPDGKSLPSAG